jgi:hypothetical protein
MGSWEKQCASSTTSTVPKREGGAKEKKYRSGMNERDDSERRCYLK